MRKLRQLYKLLFWFLFTALAQAQNPSDQIAYLFRVSDGLKSPLRITMDAHDNVFVTDDVGSRVCRFDSTGRFLGEFTVGQAPLAIAVNKQNRLIVSDRVQSELLLLDVNGQLIKKMGQNVGPFGLLSSAIFDDDNRLYVVDSQQNCVHVFDERGQFVTSFGQEKLIYPTGIAFDKKNQRILVAEHGGLFLSENLETVKMIHAFDKNGIWQSGFGKYGHELGKLSRVQGITVDRWGRIYLADIYQGLVTVLSEEGEFLAAIGKYGEQPGEMRAPMDLAIDSRGRLWVTAMNNGSIEIYDIGDFTTAVEPPAESLLPSTSTLLQNFPNPFNPGTWLPFELKKDSQVIIHIYNQMGQRVRTFDLGKKSRGSYVTEGSAIFWDGANDRGEIVASGVYLYEIRLEELVMVRRMLLLK
ncbi:MAG: FlgD immunoglobulin-like domain containing protein [bacterium]